MSVSDLAYCFVTNSYTDGIVSMSSPSSEDCSGKSDLQVNWLDWLVGTEDGLVTKVSPILIPLIKDPI